MKFQYYTSGEFAKQARVSIRTIRYYDQKNLLILRVGPDVIPIKISLNYN